MGHEFSEQDGIIVVNLEGKIMGTPQDTKLINHIYDHIDKGNNKFIFDLSRVNWINSRGLGILITVYTALNNRDGGLKLININDKVDKFLDKCKMFAVFETCSSLEEAISCYK